MAATYSWASILHRSKVGPEEITDVCRNFQSVKEELQYAKGNFLHQKITFRKEWKNKNKNKNKKTLIMITLLSKH